MAAGGGRSPGPGQAAQGGATGQSLLQLGLWLLILFVSWSQQFRGLIPAPVIPASPIANICVIQTLTLKKDMHYAVVIKPDAFHDLLIASVWKR